MAESKKLQRVTQTTPKSSLAQGGRKSHPKQKVLSKRRELRGHVQRPTAAVKAAEVLAGVCRRQLEDLANECHSLINHLTYEPDNTLVLGKHWERWEELVSEILVPDEESVPSDGETVRYPSRNSGVYGEDEGDGTRDHPYRCPSGSD